MALGQQGDWLAPEALTDTGASRAASAPALFELRPLSLGEVLDRTFALYRSRFWLFASISVVAAAVHIVLRVVVLASTHLLVRNLLPLGSSGPLPPFTLQTMAIAEGRIGLAALVFFLVAAITQAATSLAMSEVYLDRPADAKTALLLVGRRWYRWVGIAVWQAWSLCWICLVAFIPGLVVVAFGGRSGNTALTTAGGVLIILAIFAGIPVGVIFYLRNALAIPAAVVERLKIAAAMRRSKSLAGKTTGRIFVVLLIAAVLFWVVGALESPATLLMLVAPRQQHYLAQAISLTLSFLGYTVIAPVAAIGLTLVYFDQRVRKEGLDLQILVDHTYGAAPHPLPAAGVISVAGNGERILPVA